MRVFTVIILLILLVGVVLPASILAWSLATHRDDDDDEAVTPTAVPSPTPQLTDRDGDSLFDSWEEDGIDINDDGLVDLDLPTLGADPDRKDVFLEIDYMEDFVPLNEAVELVIETFERRGIGLHIQLDDEVSPEKEVDFEESRGDEFTSFDKIKLGKRSKPCDGHFGTKQDRGHPDCETVLNARKQVFRYGIFADQLEPRGGRKGGTGRAEVGGNDFILTLGALERDEADNYIFEIDIGRDEKRLVKRKLFSVAEGQAGTLMHELGHNLGLQHGGGDAANCKPNYLSVMSYPRQFPFLSEGPDFWLDYSGDLLSPLDEQGLDESTGIGRLPNRRTVFGFESKALSALADDWVDWNHNNDLDGNVAGNLNYIESVGCVGEDDEILEGYDDWDNLVFDFRQSPDFEDGIHRTARDVEEITVEQIINYALELDVDGDGLAHLLDGCPFVPDPDQADQNEDGIGDACDSIGATPTAVPGSETPTVEDPTSTAPPDTPTEPETSPEVDAGGPYEPVDEGSTITLEGTATDADGDDLALSWTVEPASGAQLEDPASDSPRITLPDDGEYVVTLKAVDPAGNTDEEAVTLTVNNVDPQIVEIPGVTGIIPGTTIFTTRLMLPVSFVDPGADVWDIEVDYGDQTRVDPLTYGPDPQRGTGFHLFNLDHDYETDGRYFVRIVVSDDDGGRTERIFLIPIQLPDLTIRNVEFETSDTSVLTFEIYNQGYGDAGPFEVQVNYSYLACDDIETPAEIFTMTRGEAVLDLAQLKSDTSSRHSVEFESQACKGTSYTITADPSQTVEEVDEDNNVVEFPGRVL